MRRQRSIRPTKVRSTFFCLVASTGSHASWPYVIAALVEEMLSALREEVKEMERTNWLYETQDPQVPMRIKI